MHALGCKMVKLQSDVASGAETSDATSSSDMSSREHDVPTEHASLSLVAMDPSSEDYDLEGLSLPIFEAAESGLQPEETRMAELRKLHSHSLKPETFMYLAIFSFARSLGLSEQVTAVVYDALVQVEIKRDDDLDFLCARPSQEIDEVLDRMVGSQWTAYRAIFTGLEERKKKLRLDTVL